MVFSSVLFLTMFLPLVLGVYFLSQEKLRNVVLLVASLLFYSWGEPRAIFVMLALIVISWAIGLLLKTPGEGASPKWYQTPRARKWVLAVGVIINLAALFFYKYLSFFVENVNLLLDKLHIPALADPKIALPIGISFYVFQIISYLIDVYRNQVEPQKKIVSFATYVSLFPQLIAGPIVRYKTIAEDLLNRHTRFDNVYYGLQRFVVGLAKKVLIADQMAVIADMVFNAPVATVPTLVAWVGALAYTLQIFYDFSGYSDMAIGLGRMFNFRFLENFEHPYSSHSIKEFWRRWHISLSSWLKDYLYIPLGGNRKGKFRTYLNSFIVFLLCGLWHGATYNFVVWGMYHGTGLVVEKVGFGRVLEKLPRILTNLYVWLFAIVGWVLFRANDLTHAKEMIKIMFTGNSGVPLNSFYPLANVLTFSNLFVFIIGMVLSYPVAAGLLENTEKRVVAWRTVGFTLMFIVTFVFATTSTFSPFIYFRF